MRLRQTILATIVLLRFAHEVFAFDTPSALNTALQSATTGSAVTLGYVIGNFSDGYLNGVNALGPVTGSLVYSDDPETANGFGILYRDRVGAGSTRVYIYHVNGTVQTAKVTAVIQNAGASAATVTFSRKSLPAASGNYASIGRTGVQQYYENASLPSSLSIPAASSALLDSGLDSLTATNGQLVHGIYDFTSDQPLTVTVLMLQSSQNTLSVFGSQSFVANDGSKREGTFTSFGHENATTSTYNTSSGIKRFRIADGSTDAALSGTDAETGLATTLSGNYGVAYRIKVNISSSDGRAVALLLNPRGGNYGGYVKTTFPYGMSGWGQLVPNPASTVTYITDGGVCALLRPTSTATACIIELIPAGAMPLPIELHLVPFTPLAAPVTVSRLELL